SLAIEYSPFLIFRTFSNPASSCAAARRFSISVPCWTATSLLGCIIALFPFAVAAMRSAGRRRRYRRVFLFGCLEGADYGRHSGRVARYSSRLAAVIQNFRLEPCALTAPFLINAYTNGFVHLNNVETSRTV